MREYRVRAIAASSSHDHSQWWIGCLCPRLMLRHNRQPARQMAPAIPPVNGSGVVMHPASWPARRFGVVVLDASHCAEQSGGLLFARTSNVSGHCMTGCNPLTPPGK